MANPALRAGALQKPSKAARRRLKTVVQRAERGQLQKLYAYVYHRDQYRCVACRHNGGTWLPRRTETGASASHRPALAGRQAGPAHEGEHRDGLRDLSLGRDRAPAGDLRQR